MILGELIDAYRWKHKKSLRTLADKIGVSAPTLMRIEQGKDCDLKTLMLVFNWMMSEEVGT